MDSDLKHRVDTLERRLNELAASVGETPRKRDWRRTIGMSADDPGFDEMIELGRQYRRSQPLAGEEDANP